MASSSSLSALCTICYAEKPKYRCPRCKTQTCSLPCSKRHKQRASCSGERDPAAYLKKNQLATPTGMDQDYNYLKKIELTIDRANHDTQDRHGGKNNKLSSSRTAARGWQPDSSLQKYLVENRIQVDRAPRGMSRQQTNHTRPTKSKRIMWTVEWIDANGHREIQQDCVEGETLGRLHRLHLLEKRNAAKKKASETAGGESTQRLQKRRRGEAQPTQQPEGKSAPNAVEVTAATTSVTREERSDNNMRDDAQPHENSTAESEPSESTASTETQPYFYLLRPATVATSQVLIPLNASATLTTCLQDRTVQEYPTIFVLNYEPATLPDEYMLEEDYLRTRGKEEAELKSIDDRAHVNAGPAGDGGVEAEEEVLDAKGILDMLKRDVRM